MRELLEKIIDACKDENTTFRIPGELYCKALEILAEPEPEPVAWMHQVSKAVVSNSRKIPGITLDDFTIPLYTTTPSQQAQVRLSDDDLRNLLALARRTLWIALCWNDHNFDDYLLYAKADADRAGITSVDAANAWLASIEALIKANGLVGEG